MFNTGHILTPYSFKAHDKRVPVTMVPPQIVDGGTASNMEGNCECIE